MKSHTWPIKIPLPILAILVILLTSPSFTFAATTKPSCELTVVTQNGKIKVTDKEKVLLVKGEKVIVEWKSKNATEAFYGNRKAIKLNGTATKTPEKATTYTYTFTAGAKKAICAVTIQVVEGSINTSTLSSLLSKPTISGFASGTKSVQIKVYKKGSDTAFYTSKVLQIKNGKWNTKVSKKLANGTYTVGLFGEKNIELNSITTSSLAIGKKAISEQKQSTTFVAESIPLLVGGIAHGGTSVPISYLQVINIGKAVGTVENFIVKQNGSASTKAIVGFTVSDDQSGKYINVGTHDDTVVFKNGTAIIPVHTHIAAGQMKLFTLKALLSNNVLPYIGQQLKLDVSNVDTNGKLTKTLLPIRGTTWTIGY